MILLLLMCGITASAQNTITHFSVWKPKEGQSANFEKGYKEHLIWHSSNKDTWNWYGWFIISGPRHGLFVDATFDHAWSDFDQPVNPAGDTADNGVHTVPFADFLQSFKVSRLAFSDPESGATLQSKFLRMFTIKVNNINQGVKMIEKATTILKKKGLIDHFLAYKVVDGGDVQQLVILIGLNNYAAYDKTADLQDYFIPDEGNNKAAIITGITSETLLFRRDMSLNL